MALNIRKNGALDLLSLGALVHRLDPGIVPFRKADSCKIHVSGGEFNVAANLADCFGMSTGIATAMVDYPIGDLVAERVKAMGVKPFYKVFQHDGATGPNIATVYSDRGYGVRPPVVFYNRANEAGGLLKPGDFDWGAIFAAGVRWFHSGGIFAALSETTADLVIEGMRAAKAAGAVVSFDMNYREKLWNRVGGPKRAREVLGRIVENVDVLIGIPDLLLDIDDEVEPEQGPKPDFDTKKLFARISKAAERYPNIQVVATTLRVVHSANRHSWCAMAWVNGQEYVAPVCELDIYDRVGSGDAFAAAFFYGLLTGATPAEAVKLGWAHGALVTTYPGDTTMATLDEVRALASGGSAMIQR